MRIEGYAFDKNYAETRAKYLNRLREIEKTPGVEYRKNPQYGMVKFSGRLTTPEAKALSELDLAIIADDGNLCFGGECTRVNDSFSGCYYTD
jgi:lipopolysaccharide assembly outer membrane protein LptD (OstA)